MLRVVIRTSAIAAPVPPRSMRPPQHNPPTRFADTIHRCQRPKCKDCGGELRMIAMTNAEARIICRVLSDHATKYQDSG